MRQLGIWWDNTGQNDITKVPGYNSIRLRYPGIEWDRKGYTDTPKDWVRWQRIQKDNIGCNDIT